MDMHSLLEGFFIARRSQLAVSTRQNYAICAKQLAVFLGEEKEIEQVTKLDLLRFANYLREERHLSERSVHDKLGICSAFWVFAHEELGIPNIVRDVTKPRWRPHPVNPFSEAEVKALVRAAEWNAPYVRNSGKPVRTKRHTALRDMAIVLVLVDTGLRASELCALEWRDYNQEAARLRVRHGKGDKERFVYLGAASQKALWRFLSSHKLEHNDPLFPTREGTAINRMNLRNLLLVLARNAKVDHVHPHRFRHTFAVAFLRNGGNVFELQRILGHERLDTVKIYMQLAQSDIATAQRKHSPADGWKL